MEQSAVTVINHPRRPRRWIVPVVVVIGLLIRLWAAWQLPVDADEPVYIDAGLKYAQLIQAGDINGIIDYTGNSEHPPLVKIIYGLTLLAVGKGAMWGQALFLTRLVSVIFGTLAVLGLALIDPLAGGFFAVQTVVVEYTSEAYLEALPLFFGLLAILLLRRSTTGRDKWFLISAIALGITAAGKYSYFPLLFVILYILIWQKHSKPANIFLYLLIAGVAFFAFDPYLWHDPLNRIVASLSYHVQYSEGAHVQQMAYPWYQPFLWVSRSWGFQWHPDVYFYFGFDGLIFLLALLGLWLNWKDKRWVTIWLLTNMLALMVWPTRWPQYTLVVLPAICLSASTAVMFIYEKIREQELYWEWFHNMFPRPSRRYFIVGGGLLGLLVVGVVISQVLVGIGRIGWSSMVTGTSGLPSNVVNDILALPDGRMLIGTDKGAAIWKAATGNEVVVQWQVFDPANSPLPNERVLAVADDRQGTYWFGTGAGLASFDGNNWTVYHAGDFGLTGEQINTIAVDGLDRIWIGSLSGAAVFDGTSWKAYTAGSTGLGSDAVFSIAIQQDKEAERVWFGTLAGVSSLDLQTGEWQSYTRQDIDLGWGGVSDLLIDSTGRLWISTEGGGISMWDGNHWSYLRVSNSKLPYSTIEAVAELEPGVFWIAASIPNSSGGVLAKYDGTTWKIYSQGLSGYSGAETVTIAKDSTGQYWFGTRTNGINLYKPRG